MPVAAVVAQQLNALMAQGWGSDDTVPVAARAGTRLIARRTAGTGMIFVIERPLGLPARLRAQETKMISKMAMPELLAIFDHAPVGIVFVREGLLQHCNRRFCELSGYAEDGSSATRPQNLRERGEYERLYTGRTEALLAGDPFRCRDPDASPRRQPSSIAGCAAAIDRDNPREGTVWIVEDLEEQTRIRDELWNAQRDLEATFAAANVGIVLIRGRRIVRANPVSRRCSAIARTSCSAARRASSISRMRISRPPARSTC